MSAIKFELLLRALERCEEPGNVDSLVNLIDHLSPEFVDCFYRRLFSVCGIFITGPDPDLNQFARLLNRPLARLKFLEFQSKVNPIQQAAA